jgi:hypothetical protein
MRFPVPCGAYTAPFSNFIDITVPTHPEFDFKMYIEECAAHEVARFAEMKGFLMHVTEAWREKLKDGETQEDAWNRRQERRAESKRQNLNYFFSKSPPLRLLREVQYYIKAYTDMDGGHYADEHIRIKELMVPMLRSIREHLIAGRDEEAFYGLFCLSAFDGMSWEEESAEYGLISFHVPSDMEWHEDQWSDVRWQFECCPHHADRPVAAVVEVAPSGHSAFSRGCEQCEKERKNCYRASAKTLENIKTQQQAASS